MIDDERVTTILVDTCAFRDTNSDFIGVNSSVLPSFFNTIKEKNMILLTHPVLEKEIEKHIEDSGLFNDYRKLVSLINKCKDVLKQADCYDENLFSRIGNYDIKAQTFKAYKKYYENAVKLDYSSPEDIFNLYFASKPPFSQTGKKKFEFPDAFVIESAKRYISEHPNDILLVISKDSDWIKSFENLGKIIMCESIDKAIEKINSIESILSEDMLNNIFRGSYNEIISEAQDYAEWESYELVDYENIEELEISFVAVKAVEKEFVPLKISREELLIKTTVSINVSGDGEVFDEDRSIWDSEDKEYVYKEYSDINFTDGNAEVECEIKIAFDFDDPVNSATVVNFKFCNRGNIGVICDESGIEIIPIDEQEMALRCLRVDKGYY